MAQSTFSIRMDEQLKKDFDTMCADFGMNATTAFNVFARAVVRERRIPFPIESPRLVSQQAQSAGRHAFEALRQQATAAHATDMPLADINNEIQQARYGDSK